ncbi:MAG: hypothetical protein LBV51_03160 [Acholeplasmatales bacterium]|jgi:ribonuclease HIII|nr:hypothetical protein [Acholeplasmatales bacterium]
MEYTLRLNVEQLNKLHKIFVNSLISSDDKNISFVASSNNNTISVYTTGLVKIQGNNPAILINSLIEALDILNVNDYIGGYDCGGSDFFGPLVIVTCFFKKEHFNFFEKYNIKNVEELSESSIERLAKEIAKVIPYTLSVFPPEKYNKLSENGYTNNRLKAVLYNSSIITLNNKIGKKVPVILDNFVTADAYFNHISKEIEQYKNVNLKPNALLTVPAVMAAYVLSKYSYLSKLKQYSVATSKELLRGTKANVTDQIKEFINEDRISVVEKIGKIAFRNYKEALK